MSTTDDMTWLTIPDVADLLGIKASQVRRLVEDRELLARRVDGVWKVPELFLRDAEPLHELKGTVILLADAGFDDEAAIDWLLSEEDSLAARPIDALRAGRKAEVRRVAQALL